MHVCVTKSTFAISLSRPWKGQIPQWQGSSADNEISLKIAIVVLLDFFLRDFKYTDYYTI